MKKYFRIYKVFLTNAVSYEAQYRGDAWLKIFLNLLWIGIMFLFIEVVFSITPELNGWSKGAVYLLAMFWVLADEAANFLFIQNVASIPDKITDGLLDAYLTKPASTLFLVSCEKITFRSFYRLLIQCTLLAFLSTRYDFVSSWRGLVVAPIILVCAVMVDYTVVLFLNTLSFWFFRINNVNDLWASFHDLGKYPLHVLPKTLRIIFLTAIPIGFSGFVPAAITAGYWPWYGAAYAIIFTVSIFLFAVWFWHFAIRHYTSASG